MKKVTREGTGYEVVNESITDSWNFWQLWADNLWEARMFKKLEGILNPDALLFDVGAWLGPISLWAAKKTKARVIAIEPDPEAYRQLEENVTANDLQEAIKLKNAAVTALAGDAELNYAELGDSKSSITKPYNNVNSVTVTAVTMEDLIYEYGAPAVVKMDIEGGESIVIPQAGELLRSLGVKLLLSTHPHWYEPGTAEAMEKELDNWDIEILDNEMLFCSPK
jgi:FkbM family methyltransferase